ncbi:putative endo-polygalacturonase [Dioscorea sansibarensis]
MEPNQKAQTDSSESLMSAWHAACTSTSSSSTIYVPTGTFLLKPVTFTGPCNTNHIIFQIDGTFIASSSYSSNTQQWIMFEHVDGVSIFGGTFNGHGQSLWSCKNSACECPDGATVINSKNIVISRLTSLDSELYHIVINGCEGVKVQEVRINAPGNTPGIMTGDDCISIGPGTSSLWIEGVSCGPGKEDEEEGVQNVTVKNTVFKGSQNGLRIKTWGRPSTSFVKDIIFQHATMQNVQNPIIIDQN